MVSLQLHACHSGTVLAGIQSCAGVDSGQGHAVMTGQYTDVLVAVIRVSPVQGTVLGFPFFVPAVPGHADRAVFIQPNIDVVCS